MLRLIKKDLQVVFSGKQFFIYILVYIPLILFLLGDSESKYSFMMIIITYAYMTTTTPFSYEITGKPHLLIQSLPVTKKEIVMARYALVFINFICSAVIAGIYLWIIQFLGFKDIEYFNLKLLKLTLPIVMIMVSFSLPVLFKLPPKVANVVNIFIYIFSINLGILNKEFVEKGAANFIMGYASGFSLIGVALIIMLISMSISIQLYKNRDFV